MKADSFSIYIVIPNEGYLRAISFYNEELNASKWC